MVWEKLTVEEGQGVGYWELEEPFPSGIKILCVLVHRVTKGELLPRVLGEHSQKEASNMKAVAPYVYPTPWHATKLMKERWVLHSRVPPSSTGLAVADG